MSLSAKRWWDTAWAKWRRHAFSEVTAPHTPRKPPHSRKEFFYAIDRSSTLCTYFSTESGPDPDAGPRQVRCARAFDVEARDERRQAARGEGAFKRARQRGQAGQCRYLACSPGLGRIR